MSKTAHYAKKARQESGSAVVHAAGAQNEE